MAFEISSIHHVSVIVKDLESALSYYCDILGLGVDTSRPAAMPFNGAWLRVGANQQIHLLELENPDSTTDRPAHGGLDRHSAFLVNNFDQLVETLETNNLPYTLSKSGRSALFTRDPDGNALEFIQA